MKSIIFLFTTVFTLLLLQPKQSFSQVTCIDSALSFNGNNQYVKLAPNDIATANFLSTLTGDYTIECLIKWNGGADFQRIFDFSYGSDYFMFLTTSENQNHVPRFAISATGLTSPQIVDANAPLVTGLYHHIAITYSKAANAVNIFIDGNPAGTNFSNIDADSIYRGSDAHDSSANYIGLSSFAGDPQLNADIDEFRISNVVRYTNAFVPSVPFTPDANTVALYHLDDGSGNIASDASGNGYNAQLGSTADADANDPLWISCSTVLATSLFNFTAIQNKGVVQLSWKAASGADYFVVEKSITGVDFTSAGKINASPGKINYAFTDASPTAGNNYYRLKQVDVSGAFKYSNTIPITINESGGFKIYPTVALNTLHITLTKTPATIVIYSTDGKPVQTINLNNTDQDINISNLAAGTYIVRNLTGNAYLKFIKQ